MAERAADYAERRAVIAKVSWWHDKTHLGFRGLLGGQMRDVSLEGNDMAALKTRLVDMAVEMDTSDG